MDIVKILTDVQEGTLSIADAVAQIKYMPFEDLKYAVIDYHRELRTGMPEIIYGEGKSLEQLGGILESMKANKAENILVTRVSEEMYDLAKQIFPQAVHRKEARLITVELAPYPKKKGTILVATGGTTDIPVAEEAAITAEFFGNNVDRLYDVGVAGLHRILSRLDRIQSASCIIVVAGMEGALSSVIGGLSDKPVIAVPTSIGYGTNFKGVSALLTMLNSCSSGVGVVNIDNGFGAAHLANTIMRLYNSG